MCMRCFGENLKREMAAAKFIPHNMAIELDLSVRSVWNYQKGEQVPDIPKLVIMSKCLQVSPNQLLRGCYEDTYTSKIYELHDKLKRSEQRRMFMILIEYFIVCHHTLAGQKLGPRIRTVRLEQGLSVEELAGALGISKTSVNSYETDNQLPGFKNFLCLCEVLNISAEFLLFESLNKGTDIMYNNLMCLSPDQVDLFLKLLANV